MLRLLPALLLMVAACAAAQPSRTLVGDDWCHGVQRDAAGRAVACEVRETLLPAAAPTIDIDMDGLDICGTHVWDRPDVLVRVRVVGRAASQDAAERLIRSAQTVVDAQRGGLRVARPPGSGDVGFTVRVFAPRGTGVTLRTPNGTTVIGRDPENLTFGC